MSELLIARLKKGEGDLQALDAYRKDPTKSQADKNAVAFAHLFELFAFTAIHELVPEYIPARDTQVQVAQALGGARGYVKVIDGQVVISPEYHTFMAQAQELKNKDNGKLA